MYYLLFVSLGMESSRTVLKFGTDDYENRTYIRNVLNRIKNVVNRIKNAITTLVRLQERQSIVVEVGSSSHLESIPTRGCAARSKYR